MPDLRPMLAADVAPAHELAIAAFDDLGRRLGEALPPPPTLPFQPADHALAAAADRHVRGAARGADLDVMAKAGYELLAYPGRGYVAHLGGAVKLLAALDDEAAAALLRTALARTPDGTRADVDWLGAGQQWAIDVAVAARLELRPAGAVCVRGRVGTLRPYLPGGAFV